MESLKVPRLGQAKCLCIARMVFFLPGMSAQVTNMVASCFRMLGKKKL